MPGPLPPLSRAQAAWTGRAGMRARGVAGVLVAWIAGCGTLANASEDAWFLGTVEPLLRARCYECHSHDAGKTKGGLALDSKSGWSAGGEHGPAVIPGQPEASLIIQAVRRTHANVAMPPKSPLSPDEVETLVRWVRDGARDPRPPRTPVQPESEPWALRPLRRPAVPVGSEGNPIDALVGAALAGRGGGFAPAAERRILLRRLTVDLHGLDPEFAEVEGFAADADPHAWGRRVDRLLGSPRYGERWARHWLDVAHFAETHGHDQDRPRESAWPYRDYVIDAFNSDRPYARFIQEQVAADGLFPADPALIPALGFLAAGPWDESSLRDIREDTLDREIARYLDRDDMIANVMSTFAGVTVHCARCHDHKFDPISQRDYYALQAVFAGTEKAERWYDLDPGVHATRERWMRLQVAIDRRETNVVEALREDALRADQRAWESSQRERTVAWTPIEPMSWTHASGTTLERQPDLSLLASGAAPTSEVTTVMFRVPLGHPTALRLEVLPDDRLPARGPGRAANGNFHLTDLTVALASASRPELYEPIELHETGSDFDQEGWTAAHAVDADPATGWGIHPQEGRAHAAVFNLREPRRNPLGGVLRVVLRQEHGRGHTLGRFRVSLTEHPAPVRLSPLPSRLVPVLAKSETERSRDEAFDLTLHYLSVRVADELKALPEPKRVFAGAGFFPANGGQKAVSRPRPVRVLRRGEITQPMEEATPGALSCVAGLPSRFEAHEDGALRRADLALWLSHRDNPLVWRTVVNRVWYHHFGRGIVDTPNDLGRMGSVPASQDLLDWLAVTFRDDLGGSFKALHRLILTSRTWQQVAADPQRAHPFQPLRRRLDAETYRDTLLALGGGLDLTMGGPSTRHFLMTPGIHVTPNVDYAGFDLATAGSQRRAVYRFLFRTLPDPLMDAMDSPPGDQSAPVRSESFTALQAFALMNHPLVFRQSEALASRARAAARDEAEHTRWVLRWVTLREPAGPEFELAAAHVQRHGLADLCRVLLNGNAFHFVD